ncbi:hypothetical protein Tb11.01.1150 [Trypanosoma brucei brucei TREU927]|uniref:Uncharacterized protein n=1 Tax=Trypanosoma brucei brucei (strain 927/4 GUTat10.1) TaxID=185431 RepID=Q383Z1_TRYB2|nr:hypothetical protein Tb11.01.1150 [Trypanosoma brucei brucei TREU927]EAN79890.1 hypothetical protein Tb11.01.1150 [Trypanosoma brucei brucei TREU927]
MLLVGFKPCEIVFLVDTLLGSGVSRLPQLFSFFFGGGVHSCARQRKSRKGFAPPNWHPLPRPRRLTAFPYHSQVVAHKRVVRRLLTINNLVFNCCGNLFLPICTLHPKFPFTNDLSQYVVTCEFPPLQLHFSTQAPKNCFRKQLDLVLCSINVAVDVFHPALLRTFRWIC